MQNVVKSLALVVGVTAVGAVLFGGRMPARHSPTAKGVPARGIVATTVAAPPSSDVRLVETTEAIEGEPSPSNAAAPNPILPGVRTADAAAEKPPAGIRENGDEVLRPATQEMDLRYPVTVLGKPTALAAEISPDQKLANAVLKALQNAPLTAYAIDIEVSKGVLTLTGAVATDEQRRAAESAAGGVEGISTVINRLAVAAARARHPSRNR